ncbi:aa3-type cytochrome c oxidase subunit IV [Tsuneonella mangrovi]|nr:aa3-type cytochrome c oxidase subunit IV [Tsuneonella mangrovi]
MADTNDMKAHEATYGSFTTLLRVAVPAIAIITLIVILIISR